nr:classical arabinogalactan protein 9-like [Aegilops tauschii subsp. strangulata]
MAPAPPRPELDRDRPRCAPTTVPRRPVPLDALVHDNAIASPRRTATYPAAPAMPGARWTSPAPPHLLLPAGLLEPRRPGRPHRTPSPTSTPPPDLVAPPHVVAVLLPTDRPRAHCHAPPAPL